jgi:hypothetical protein
MQPQASQILRDRIPHISVSFYSSFSVDEDLYVTSAGKKDALTLSRTVLECRVGRRSMRNKHIFTTPRLEAVTMS